MGTYNDIRTKISGLPPEERDDIGFLFEAITSVIDAMAIDELHVEKAELPLEIRYRGISAILGLIDDINTLLLRLISRVQK